MTLTTLADKALADLRTPALDGSNYETTGTCPHCSCSKGGDVAEPNPYTEACTDSGCRCHTECSVCHQRTVLPYRPGRLMDCPVCYPANPNLHCQCGAKTDNINRSADDKCPICRTFSTDHAFYGGEDSDWRCYECDIRMGSHRR